MTEKEKEAIKTVKTFNENNKFRDCGKLNNAIDTVLNLIQKQQEEIKMKDEMIRKIYNENEQEKVDLRLQYIAELAKKDKIINDAINFIQDNCLEEIADMKGCYREIASVGDLQELINILKGK